MAERRASRRPGAEATSPDLDAAAKFLRWLDRDAEAFTFQTWPDGGGDRRLVRLLHGSLDEHADELADLNRRGAAVAVTMNETDLEGTKRENIVRVRAVVLDLDDGPLEPVWDCLLKPHIAIESSPGRHHVYWLVGDGDGDVLEEFEGVQRAVAERFDGDPAVDKLTHRARLPGFDHRKAEPFRARVKRWFPHKPHSWDEVLAEFPPINRPHRLPSSRLVFPKGAYLQAARVFLAEQFARDNVNGLVAHRGDFFQWTGSRYQKLGRRNLNSLTYEYLDRCWIEEANGAVKPLNPTRGKVGEVLAALEAGVNEDEGTDPPFWLPPINRVASSALVACRNGLLDIETGELAPHDPHYFNVNALPFDFDPGAGAPGWSRFLRELWPDEEEAPLALAEWFGYFLTADTSQQKVFMLVGPKRSGKGTIGRALTALLGRDNVTGPTLASLGNEFGLWPLINKRIAIVSDARLSSRSDTSVVVERLLAISGEDSITVNRKYQSHWTGRLGVRFLLLTNELPSIKDASQALASRFLILPMQESFYDREDPALTDKLLSELPGILNWALRGLDRLRRRGYFRVPKSSRDVMQTLEDLSSPVGAFLRDWCVVAAGRRGNVKVLYGAWKAWCEGRGEQAGSDRIFGKDLRAAAPHVRTRGSGAQRYYEGVGLSEYGQERYDRARET